MAGVGRGRTQGEAPGLIRRSKGKMWAKAFIAVSAGNNR